MYQCLQNGKPCVYKPNSGLGWDTWEYSSLEDAQKYMAKFLGDFWDSKEEPLFPYPFQYDLYGTIYEIVEK